LPRSEEVLQQIRDDQRQNILKAAQVVFTKKGGTATMAEVASEAGISQGLAYRYFTSKEEIFSTLVEHSIQAAGEYDKIIQKLPGTPIEKLGLIIERLLELRKEQPRYYQFVYQMLNDEMMPANLRKMMARRSSSFQQEMRQLIVEGQQLGEIAKDDPDQILEAIMASMEGLWKRMTYADPEKMIEILPDARIILRMLKPD
jgi:AcrR family transcriptional regulator